MKKVLTLLITMMALSACGLSFHANVMQPNGKTQSVEELGKKASDKKDEMTKGEKAEQKAAKKGDKK